MKNKFLVLFSVLTLTASFSVTAKVCVKNSTLAGVMKCAYDSSGTKPTSGSIPIGQSCKYNHSTSHKRLTVFFYSLKDGKYRQVYYQINPKNKNLYICKTEQDSKLVGNIKCDLSYDRKCN